MTEREHMSTLHIPAGGAGQFTGYLAMPAGAPKGCVAVVQEIYGVNREVRRVTDWLGSAGFAAVAPDLLWRVKPGLDFDYADRDNARKAVGSLNPEAIAGDIVASIEALRAKADPAKAAGVGILALGWAGKFAFMAASKTAVDALVAYYPGNIDGSIELVHSAAAPQMFHFAGRDERTKPEFRRALRAAMADRDDVEIYVYPDADHGFANRDRGEYHAASAALADERTTGLLQRMLVRSGV